MCLNRMTGVPTKCQISNVMSDVISNVILDVISDSVGLWNNDSGNILFSLTFKLLDNC